jgi:amidohydrolase
MIAAGVLDDPKVDAIAMLHVDPRLPTGSVGITPGPVNAAADELHVTVHGKGGHGGYPHLAVDAIPASAAIVLAMQTIAARETDPLAAIVVTIGTIAGGYRNNVIADVVKMTGTIRTYEPAVRNAVEERVRRIVEGVAAGYGATAEVTIVYGYPPVVNDVALATAFAAHLTAQAGIPVEQLAPTMGAEDFAYFAERVPGVVGRLGIRNEQLGSIHSGHSPQFRLDEDAIPTGITTLVAFAEGITSGALRATR